MLHKPFRFSLVPISLLCFGSVVPAGATPPAWWTEEESPVLNGAPENNMAVVNVGQAKWMVSKALTALQERLPEVARLVIEDLDGTQPDHSDRILDLSLPEPLTPEWLAKQGSPLAVGQLKAIAAPFYKRLNDAIPNWLTAERISNGTNIAGSFYPWTATTSDDSNMAMAAIGQLKAVFSLRFESLPADADSDQDWPDPEIIDPIDLDDTGILYDDGGDPAPNSIPNSAAVTGVIFTYDFGRLVKASGQGVEAAYQYDKAGNIETISPQ